MLGGGDNHGFIWFCPQLLHWFPTLRPHKAALTSDVQYVVVFQQDTLSVPKSGRALGENCPDNARIFVILLGFL